MTTYRSPTLRHLASVDRPTPPPGPLVAKRTPEVLWNSQRADGTPHHRHTPALAPGRETGKQTKFDAEVLALAALLLQTPKSIVAFVNRWMSMMPNRDLTPSENLTQLLEAVVTWPVSLQLNLEYAADATRTRHTVSGSITLFANYATEISRELECDLPSLRQSLETVQGDLTTWQWDFLLAFLVALSDELFEIERNAPDGGSQRVSFRGFRFDDDLARFADRSAIFACLLNYLVTLAGDIVDAPASEIGAEVDPVEQKTNADVVSHVLELTMDVVGRLNELHTGIAALRNPALDVGLCVYDPERPRSDAEYIKGIPCAVLEDETKSFQWLRWVLVDRAASSGMKDICRAFWVAKSAILQQNASDTLDGWTHMVASGLDI